MNNGNDVKRFWASIVVPTLFIALLWMVKITEIILHADFYKWGIYPLSTEGLKGIIFWPLIHGSMEHLISNTFPLLILGTALFYFYRELGFTVSILGWLISGVWVWVFARPSWHIGASGIIYCWAAFLFVSGVIRNHPRLMALSLLVVFIYGSLIWGIFPLREGVSWEGHLMGAIAGLVLALFFKETGPVRKKYSWDFEDDDTDENQNVNYEGGSRGDERPYWAEPTSTSDFPNQKN